MIKLAHGQKNSLSAAIYGFDLLKRRDHFGWKKGLNELSTPSNIKIAKFRFIKFHS